MCKHFEAKNKHYHTCAGFYDLPKVVYCVHCIIEKFADKPVVGAKLSDLNPFEDLNWNGELYMEGLGVRHVMRIWLAEDYPIFITTDNCIIDGCHRVYRAHICGQSEIRAIVLTQEDLDQCIFEN